MCPSDVADNLLSCPYVLIRDMLPIVLKYAALEHMFPSFKPGCLPLCFLPLLVPLSSTVSMTGASCKGPMDQVGVQLGSPPACCHHCLTASWTFSLMLSPSQCTNTLGTPEHISYHPTEMTSEFVTPVVDASPETFRSVY